MTMEQNSFLNNFTRQANLVSGTTRPAPIDLDALLSYSLSLVPHCLVTIDGFFSKTNKGSMFWFLMKDYNVNLQYSRDYMLIQDGNALSRRLVDFPPTFGSICLQILDLMDSKKSFILSRDCFNPDSVKT